MNPREASDQTDFFAADVAVCISACAGNDRAEDYFDETRISQLRQVRDRL